MFDVYIRPNRMSVNRRLGEFISGRQLMSILRIIYFDRANSNLQASVRIRGYSSNDRRKCRRRDEVNVRCG
jgi:hypothetical protein